LSERAATVLVWDLPVRLFHWTLAALIAFSWWSAEYGHVDWHIWSGCAILTLLIFRVLWGRFGSSTARFANFVRGPRAVFAYLRDSETWRGIGHSPLGALSVLALLVATAAQVGLGLISTDEDGFNQGPLANFVSLDTSDSARELHEIMFYVLLALIALHVAAILFYRLVHHKKLVGAMITGKAEAEAGAEPMRRGRWWVALLCLIAALAFTRWIIAGAPPL
jgi:cytochrome b